MSRSAYDAARRLARAAARLEGPRRGLPALFLFTDPERTPDPLATARRLPAGCGIVLRHFGRPELRSLAAPLSELARERGLTLLIAADAELAHETGAAGVHWPEARRPEADRRRGGMMQTFSAHGAEGVRRADANDADAVFLSPVFASASPSAGAPLGGRRAGVIAQRARTPVYALGGVNVRTINRLRGLGFSGAACVSALEDGG